MKLYTKKLILLATDVLLIVLSFYIAMFFRFDGAIPDVFIGLFYKTCGFIILTKLVFFYVFGLYRSLWRYASIGEVLQIFFAVILSIMFDYISGSMLGTRLPRTVYAIAALLLIMFIGGSRFSYRVFTGSEPLTQ